MLRERSKQERRKKGNWRNRKKKSKSKKQQKGKKVNDVETVESDSNNKVGAQCVELIFMMTHRIWNGRV